MTPFLQRAKYTLNLFGEELFFFPNLTKHTLIFLNSSFLQLKLFFYNLFCLPVKKVTILFCLREKNN